MNKVDMFFLIPAMEDLEDCYWDIINISGYKEDFVKEHRLIKSEADVIEYLCYVKERAVKSLSRLNFKVVHKLIGKIFESVNNEDDSIMWGYILNELDCYISPHELDCIEYILSHYDPRNPVER